MSLDDTPKSNYEILSGNADIDLWYLKREEPPAFIKVLPSISSEHPALADDEWQSAQVTLKNPSQDPREDWKSISYNLAAHELFSTGGLCVDQDCQNWHPLLYQAELLSEFIERNIDSWTQGDGTKSSAYRDARCILFQAKDQLLQREASSKKRKYKHPTKTKQPEAFSLINREMKKVCGPVDHMKIDAIIRRLSAKVHFQRDPQATTYLVESLAECVHIHLGKRDARKLVLRITKEQAKRDRPTNQHDAVPIVNEWSDHEMADFAQDRLAENTDSSGNPAIYHYEDDVCDMHNGSRRMLTEPEFGAQVTCGIFARSPLKVI
jgi:hypothetical protein